MGNHQFPATPWPRVAEKVGEILNLRAEISKRELLTARIIEQTGAFLARPMFFFVVLVVHLAWILVSLPVYPWFRPWDLYPFVFLATIASVEAPFIALPVLMYQRHQNQIAELREELDLQVALHLERQSSVMLRLISEIQDEMGVVTRQDKHVLDILQDELDPRRLMDSGRKDLAEREW